MNKLFASVLVIFLVFPTTLFASEDCVCDSESPLLVYSFFHHKGETPLGVVAIASLGYSLTETDTEDQLEIEVFGIGAYVPVFSTAATSTYAYAGTDYANPHAATSIGTTNYTYDNNGNVTSTGATTFTWDYRDRLTQIATTTTSTYAYDHNNDRVRQTIIGSATTTYPSQLYATSTTGTSTIRGGNKVSGTFLFVIQ